ncbi:uncharacterized protein LOC127797491 isoform X2 [Diospyros lotus]|uniref:uncharacterized protein LOC127797491 isoform X2 n=1 Tax=Diospyros lotus TaxID=55363 RepID=UPI00224CF7ED|nr:uncharacterized protein LOC127797491 isoform X2 [Diospyros lotus]
MGLGNKQEEKSRRERRKEARLLKKKTKSDSWIEHQKYCKSRKLSWHSNSEHAKRSQNSSGQSIKGRVLLQAYPDPASGHSSELPATLRNSEVKFEAPNSTVASVLERKKGLKKESETVFEEFPQMQMQQDAIFSAGDFALERKLAKKLKVKDGKLGGIGDGINELLEGIPHAVEGGTNPVHEEILKRRSDNNCLNKKRTKSMALRNELEGNDELAGETVVGLSKTVENCYKPHESPEQTTVLKKSQAKLHSSKNSDSAAADMAITKKTKFEEFLEMEMLEGVVSAESDLYLERKLTKKLKVKEGKLRDEDDGINLLIEGIPSVLDSFQADEDPCDVASRKSSKNSYKKMKTSEQELEAVVEVGTPAVESEPVETFHAKMKLENVPAKAPKLDANVKYLAPHLRSHVGNETEDISQIRRRVRGLLNRLSESNLESITGELSIIFRSVARGIGSQIIIEEVLASCSGGPRGNEQYAAVFAAFVAGMACLVGIDFSAKLLASLAKCFQDEYLEEDNLSLRNLTLLLSYLYIFGVCSSELIYDFMIILSNRLMEVDVSTILTILHCCGMNLRSDNPSAMKNFVLCVQNRANALKGSSENGQKITSNKRMEFMLETIFEIKNNKKKAKEDTPHHTWIKKWLQKLRVEDILIRGLKWSKLLDPDKKGQWWSSGDMDSTIGKIEEVSSTIDKESLEAHKLMQLAAAQRMNTEVRRAIFCVIMSGEDYIDAFEKLLRLDVQGKQEQVFNKYYSVLAAQLCRHDKEHRTTLQFCLWDHFKDLESMQLIRSRNLSHFVAEMIASFTLSLSVLKVVDFSDATQLTGKRIIHFKMLFEAIFERPDGLVWNIFTRIAADPQYESLRNGIEFFIKNYVVSENSHALKFKVVKKALANIEGVLM